MPSPKSQTVDTSSNVRLAVMAYRTRKASVLSDLQESVNFHRSLLSLTPHDFTQPRPTPPSIVEFPHDEELANMTKAELLTWRKMRRCERKNAMHKEKCRQRNIMIGELQRELADLKRRVEEMERRKNAIVKIKRARTNLRTFAIVPSS